MAASLINKLRYLVMNLENRALLFLRGGYPEASYALACPAVCERYETVTNPSESQSMLERLLGDNILWAVPKKRRSLEKRMSRRMGLNKLCRSRSDIVVCVHCGHHHQARTVCGHCYEKVQKETEEIREKMKIELWEDRIRHCDQEVVVVYEGENKDKEFYKGKRIVEMEKTRPPWFPSNLYAKSREDHHE